MALIKMKPTSPGTRFVVKIDRSHLHKGGPLASLTTKKNRTGARNHSGRQTQRLQESIRAFGDRAVDRLHRRRCEVRTKGHGTH